jgi:general stress protein 26
MRGTPEGDAMANERPPISEVHTETDFDKLDKLIRDIKFAMMTTIDANGALQSRPMTTQKRPEGRAFDGTLYFFTGLKTGTVEEISRDPRVSLSYASPDDSRYVAITGTAEISRDRSLMQSMWSDIYKAWFPQALDDPEICLLKVTAERAEYWEPPSGKMVQLLGILKAAATGERAKPGGHHVLDMEHAPGEPRAAKVKTTSSW